ncbi:solute carrier family 23 protein [Alistipes putredinis]|uniref:solute carrier family 23 protein n=1 Tax=Alistipes putredinis TaxID=28117 RepID=UPI003991EA6F
MILRLIFAGNSSVLFHLFFALLLALAMILANKLLKGIWKSIVVLGGILVGSMVYYSVMGFPETGGIQAGHEGYFGLWPWKFDLGAVLSFFFCFIALIVNELGSIQAVGRMIGADHMERRTTRGVGITGLANVVSGALGIVGPVDYSMSPGIIAATGCASRFPLIPAGIGLVVCAFFPGFIECLNAIPGVVMGAVLLYLMASQLSAGMQMMIREKAVDGFDGGIVVGFSLMVALLLSFAPDEALNSIPALIRPIVGNGFVMGVITVLILEHLIFRAGKKLRRNRQPEMPFQIDTTIRLKSDSFGGK